jgi:hypothetical protein
MGNETPCRRSSPLSLRRRPAYTAKIDESVPTANVEKQGFANPTRSANAFEIVAEFSIFAAYLRIYLRRGAQMR